MRHTIVPKRLMYFPTWVDLKGQDSVPETVHHVVLMCDPKADSEWSSAQRTVQTDGVHHRDRVGPGENSPEAWSEAIKLMKAQYCFQAIQKLNMDYGIIFCRTKVDCDNLERYLRQVAGSGYRFSCVCLHGDRRPPERRANLEKFKVCM